MKARKTAARIIAAAMAIMCMPLAVGAESDDFEINAGDTFYVEFDPKTGTPVTDKPEYDSGFGTNGFYACVLLPDGTISVRTGCLENRWIHSGNSIAIPEKIAGYTVTQIGNSDGACLGGYASITLPDTVTSINKAAFGDNVLLEEINFGENSQLKYIGEWAFQNCRSLKSINIPANVETIDAYAFINGNDSYNLNLETCGEGDYTNIFSLESVTFAEGSKLKTIGAYAFQEQEALKSITLPDSVETIENNAFMSCFELAQVNISENSRLRTIGQWAFQDCRSLKSIDLPEGLKIIDAGAFCGCTSLNSITIPASVETISSMEENGPVFGNTSIGEINFAENSGLKTIGNMAFCNMPMLKSVTIPASVDTIGNYAFNRAYSGNDDESLPIPTPSVLTNIYVDENNETFKSVDGVVYSKDGTEFVAYPIGRNEGMVIPEGVTKIKDGVCHGAYITSLTIPSTVAEIPFESFCYCFYLTEVNLPETLTAIDECAFQRAAFTSITIPESVTYIDPLAFYESRLTNINGTKGSYAETFAMISIDKFFFITQYIHYQ